jgi:hypothetical protein
MKLLLDPFQIGDMCKGKSRYPSKRVVNEHLKKTRLARRNRKKSLRAYCCPICKGWHLTSQ